MGSVLRYLDRHPWMALATGVGIAGVSILKIRRERKSRRDMKAAAKEEKRLRKLERNSGRKTLKSRAD